MKEYLSCLVVTLAAAVIVCTSPVSAQDDQDVTAAANAFRRAQAAQLREDHEQAAVFYELAYDFAPSIEALRSAMRERRKAGHDAIAASHALTILSEYPNGGKTTTNAQKLVDELSPSLIRVSVDCSPSPCVLTIDDKAAADTPRQTHEFFVTSGTHQVAAVADGQATDPRRVVGGGGDRRQLSFDTSPVEAQVVKGRDASSQQLDGAGHLAEESGTTRPLNNERAAKQAEGLSPIVFYVSLGLTILAGGGTLWSALDTNHRHDEYLALQAAGAPEAEVTAAYEEGLDLELRTNLLLAGTGAFAVTSVILGLLTDWNGDDDGSDELSRNSPKLQLNADPTTLKVDLGVRF